MTRRDRATEEELIGSSTLGYGLLVHASTAPWAGIVQLSLQRTARSRADSGAPRERLLVRFSPREGYSRELSAGTRESIANAYAKNIRLP